MLLDKSFLEDIECVLQDGSVNIKAMDDFSQLRGVLESLPINETSVVLINSKKSVEAIKEYALPRDKSIDVLTMQSIKGLEAQNIVIHNFLPFLQTTLKNDRKLFFRKIYVLLTRSKENLYVSIPEKLDENLPNEIKSVIETIKKYASIAKAAEGPNKDEKNRKLKNKTSIHKTRAKRYKRRSRTGGDWKRTVCHNSWAVWLEFRLKFGLATTS